MNDNQVKLSLKDAEDALALIKEMSHYVGKMALSDYQRFSSVPSALYKAIKLAKEGLPGDLGALNEALK